MIAANPPYDDERPSTYRPLRPALVPSESLKERTTQPAARPRAPVPPTSIAEELRRADAAACRASPLDPSAYTVPCPLARYAIEVQVLTELDRRPVRDLQLSLWRDAQARLVARTDVQGRVRFEGLAMQGYTLSLPELDDGMWAFDSTPPLTPADSTGDASWASPASAPPASSVYRVAQGECLAEVADRHGVLPDAIWNDAGNADLKRARVDGQILAPGDTLAIPARGGRHLDVRAATSVRLMHKAPRVVFRTRFLDSAGRPRAGLPYLATLVLADGDEVRSGNTDRDGYLTECVQPDIDEIAVTLCKERPLQEFYRFKIAFLDPVDMVSGVQARLLNLGYRCAVTGAEDRATGEALRAFQRDYGLPESGVADPATRQRLVAEHAS